MHLEFEKAHDVLLDDVRDTINRRPPQFSTSKRLANRWNHRLSYESLSQGVSPLKNSVKTSTPLVPIPLGVGRPASLFYPWQSMTMTGTKESNTASPMTCKIGEVAFDLSSALNYADPSGSTELVACFRENTRLIHNPPYHDWDTTLTCGSTSAIDIVLRMFCNRGDWILTEASTYTGTVMASKAHGLKIQSIEMDEEGLVPADLDFKLRHWDMSRGRKPYVLYTIPSGHNPTGVTQSTARKAAIYQVAERYDLLILEDDPYFFLRLDASSSSLDINPPYSSFEKLRASLPSSYLSLDKAGRVIRVDSTSKILAPGLRCGWLTASKQIVEIFENFAEVGPAPPGGPSQVMLYKLLVESWGQEGFANWLNHLSREYKSRRDIMIAACSQHLPAGLCAWTTPTHGMFLWITIDLRRHPDYSEKRTSLSLDLEEKIYQRAANHGVAVAKGSWFNIETCLDKVFFRVTFVSTTCLDELEYGIKRLGVAVREEFRLPKA
ncbi:aromatic amino acid aminotransferase [Nannizzia gypsea CBS 118893]|uniref:Aromatic amino acid aminotransferase n=1 Tax=Arthroderma gypseum (strain ATCC MYA-4604 / CBS 118893) TaxID=535722 RepID=E5R3D8_ARTGP|nr:aromatic amino acid aminotransferase [Nannizzia gypsea CBS 118893]EFQ97953.1 aromatic amino acid aminotransferase [Nannizzia gypsea CBS 118893]